MKYKLLSYLLSYWYFYILLAAKMRRFLYFLLCFSLVSDKKCEHNYSYKILLVIERSSPQNDGKYFNIDKSLVGVIYSESIR